MNVHQVLLALLLGLFSAAAAGQGTRTVPLGQRKVDTFELRPVSPAHTFSFQVGSATELVIDVRSTDAPLEVQVVDAVGTKLDPGTFAYFTIGADETPELGAALFAPGEHVQLTVPNPPAGAWSISVTLPAGAISTIGTITTHATGGAGVAATTSRPTYQASQPVVLALLAFEGAIPIIDGSVVAEIYQTGGERSPQLVTLRDDGVEPDARSGDGIYSASITGLLPGHYLAKVSLHRNSEEFIGGTDFVVTVDSARLTGTSTDAGSDTNNDGLFDIVTVDIGVAIETAGSYEVVAELHTATGNAVIGAARAELAPGAQSISVPFAATDLRRYLAIDGPWQIRNVRLLTAPVAPSAMQVLTDQIDGLGLTKPYTLAQLQRPITLIIPGITDSALDTNGDGLYEQLTVSFQVDTRSAGHYTWTGDLRAPDGTTLGVAIGQGYLAAGVIPVSFAFEGRPIGASNLDGPYTVGNVAIYGPVDAAAVIDEVGHTREYQAAQFEGGEVTFARLVNEVQRLVITGVGGVPRGEGIRNSLYSKAQNARHQADRGNRTPAANMLNAFIHELQAQTGKHVDVVDVDRLVMLATRLRDTL